MEGHSESRWRRKKMRADGKEANEVVEEEEADEDGLGRTFLMRNANVKCEMEEEEQDTKRGIRRCVG